MVLKDNYRELVEHNYLYHIPRVNSTFQSLPISLPKLPGSEFWTSDMILAVDKKLRQKVKQVQSWTHLSAYTSVRYA